MKTRMFLVAGSLGMLISTAAFADDEAGSAAAATAPKMRAQAQFELLPLGSASTKIGDTTVSEDTSVAYGISAGFDYAVMPYLSIGVAPRLILNVIGKDAPANTDASKALDLRARIVGHFPVAPKLEIFGSVMPGYTIGLSSQEGESAKGFAIAGSAGLTYDVTPSVFLSAEAGYQRAFITSEVMTGGQTITSDGDLSYMHIGLGAGTRF